MASICKKMSSARNRRGRNQIFSVVRQAKEVGSKIINPGRSLAKKMQSKMPQQLIKLFGGKKRIPWVPMFRANQHMFLSLGTVTYKKEMWHQTCLESMHPWRLLIAKPTAVNALMRSEWNCPIPPHSHQCQTMSSLKSESMHCQHSKATHLPANVLGASMESKASRVDAHFNLSALEECQLSIPPCSTPPKAHKMDHG